MSNNIEKINNLIVQKNELLSRLKSYTFLGIIEIKTIGEKKYLYVRQHVNNVFKSTYISQYDSDLHAKLLKDNKEAKEIKKQLKLIEKELNELGYKEGVLSEDVILARNLARKHRSLLIYDQAVLEGIGTTFSDTEDIIENGIVHNSNVEDVTKLINLKRAWEFVLDNSTLLNETDYSLISYIASLVNENLVENGGEIRITPVRIGGCTYIPPIPLEQDVISNIEYIIHSNDDAVKTAIELCCYIMKKQIYRDGNKRTAVLAANHFLISKGIGILAIDTNKVSHFKNLLGKYYESKDLASIKDFLKECILYVR